MATTRQRSLLRTIPLEFLFCRDRSIGHRWDIGDSTDHFAFSWRMHTRRDGTHEIVRSSRCERCGMTRDEYFAHTVNNHRAVKVRSVYTPPDGYALPAGDQGPVRSADVVGEQMRRSSKPRKTRAK